MPLALVDGGRRPRRGVPLSPLRAVPATVPTLIAQGPSAAPSPPPGSRPDLRYDPSEASPAYAYFGALDEHDGASNPSVAVASEQCAVLRGRTLAIAR